MVCYVPGTGTLAVMESTLVVGAAVAAVTLVIWTARMIQRRRAVAGACTTCRFRCQQALQPRPNLLVNIVDRRQTAPKPVLRASLPCHAAAPILGRARTPARHAAAPAPALFRRAAGRLRTPVHVQAPAAAPAHAAVRAPAAVPAAALFRRAIARRRTPALAPAVLFERAIAAHRTPVEPAPLLPVLGSPVLGAPVLS